MAKTKWSADSAHSELGFKIKHMMIANVSGSFKDFNVEAETEDEDFSTLKIRVTAKMASIFTNNEHRDQHLRNSDFFEVDKYPELVFESTKIEKSGDDSFLLHGDLTLRGITKPVILNVEHSNVVKDNWGGERAGFTLTGKIKRAEWGVSFGGLTEAGGVALGEEVKLVSEIQLVKQTVPVLAEA